MNNLLDRITLDREVCNGKPTIRGLHIYYRKNSIGIFSCRRNNGNILDAYPVLKKEDIFAAMQYELRCLIMK